MDDDGMSIHMCWACGSDLHSEIYTCYVQERQAASSYAVLFHDNERAVIDFEAEEVRGTEDEAGVKIKQEPIASAVQVYRACSHAHTDQFNQATSSIIKRNNTRMVLKSTNSCMHTYAWVHACACRRRMLMWQ